MNLGELKQHFEGFDDDHVFDYSLSEPFSWRGSYAEVAFSIKEEPSTKEDMLKNIELATTNQFYGYKGGEYRYNEHTPINFERGYSSWSDEGYVKDIISDIKDELPYKSIQQEFITLAFK